MFPISALDVLGYSAMALLLISFAMKNVIMLRTINTVGCLLFTIWGLLSGAYPVVITNISIMVINLFFLIKHYRTAK